MKCARCARAPHAPSNTHTHKLSHAIYTQIQYTYIFYIILIFILITTRNWAFTHSSHERATVTGNGGSRSAIILRNDLKSIGVCRWILHWRWVCVLCCVLRRTYKYWKRVRALACARLRRYAEWKQCFCMGNTIQMRALTDPPIPLNVIIQRNGYLSSIAQLINYCQIILFEWNFVEIHVSVCLRFEFVRWQQCYFSTIDDLMKWKIHPMEWILHDNINWSAYCTSFSSE